MHHVSLGKTRAIAGVRDLTGMPETGPNAMRIPAPRVAVDLRVGTAMDPRPEFRADWCGAGRVVQDRSWPAIMAPLVTRTPVRPAQARKERLVTLVAENGDPAIHARRVLRGDPFSPVSIADLSRLLEIQDAQGR